MISPCGTTPPHVSVVVTFHGEQRLARHTLLALQRCRLTAERHAISVQIVAVLDDADPVTRAVVSGFEGFATGDRVLEVGHGDVAASRNHAIRAAGGRQVLLCDGDDYVSANLIVACRAALAGNPDGSIVRPELVVTFDAAHELWWQVGDDAPGFDADSLLMVNPWVACCFAAREVFLGTPFHAAEGPGFGYEDWHWNCETIARGHRHRIAHGTVYYARRKKHGSLMAAQTANNALIAPTALFNLRYGG